MWISKARYTELVKAETRSDWLIQRVNELNLDVANLRTQITGVAHPVPIIHRENTPKPVSVDTDDFADMGDDAALKHGAKWDDSGRVYYDG